MFTLAFLFFLRRVRWHSGLVYTVYALCEGPRVHDDLLDSGRLVWRVDMGIVDLDVGSKKKKRRRN